MSDSRYFQPKKQYNCDGKLLIVEPGACCVTVNIIVVYLLFLRASLGSLDSIWQGMSACGRIFDRCKTERVEIGVEEARC